MSKSHIIKTVSLFLLCTLANANTLAEKWKSFPKQHLVTKDYQPSLAPTVEENITYEYEDLIVFSLRATIAAFHFDPKTFSDDQTRLSKFFESNALSQIEQSLYAATGSGLMDSYIIQQKPCSAITRSPATIEKKAPHYARIRLPMVLQDKRTVDVILSIKISNVLKITDFSIEDPKEE